MATATAISPQTAGIKRRATDDTDTNPTQHKRQRIQHETRNTQQQPVKHIEPALQDQEHPSIQLAKSVGTALTLAGYDAVRPEALEMFKSHAEEYMLAFLSNVRMSMTGSRRTTPTALDFTVATSSTPNAPGASPLKPQLHLPLPPSIALPSLPEPEPERQDAPELDYLLEPLLETKPPSYIPSHFPKLPAQHAWKSTDVFAQREKDARKMREQATQDGKDAENALRKLAAAAKQGAMKAERAERRRSSLPLADLGRMRNGQTGMAQGGRGKGKVKQKKDDVLADLLNEMDDGDARDEAGSGEAGVEGMDAADIGMSKGVVVNHDVTHWRRGAATQGLRL